jgi:hypothetical protein
LRERESRPRAKESASSHSPDSNYANFYDDMEMKSCTRCLAELPPTEFYRAGTVRRSGEHYLDTRCKACMSETFREQRLRLQLAGPRPHVCECCSRAGKTHLDHSHATGLIRGWLCAPCNTGIGGLGDELAQLHETLAYLVRFLDREGLSEETTRSPRANEGCKTCGEQREESDFGICARSSRGVRRRKTCRFCTAAAEAQKRRLAKIVGPRAHACEICRREGPTELDHDHTTGAFRGWLCKLCNLGLGKLGDDVAGVRRAIAYLERSITRVSGSRPEERARSRSR